MTAIIVFSLVFVLMGILQGKFFFKNFLFLILHRIKLSDIMSCKRNFSKLFLLYPERARFVSGRSDPAYRQKFFYSIVSLLWFSFLWI